MQKNWVLFSDNPPVHNNDWRNVAINHALLQSYNAEWIWFTEQDFIIKDSTYFWGTVYMADDNGAEFIAVKESDRIHPCCMFIKRSLLARTSREFSANPPLYDHFGKLTQEVEKLGPKAHFIDKGWQHMAGLSHNLRLVEEGGLPNYKPLEFDTFARESLLVTVPQNETFNRLLSGYLDKTKPQG